MPKFGRLPGTSTAATRDDLTAQFNTALSPADEVAFQAWASSTGRAADLEDYDLRGAWAAGIRPDARGHLPDTYKKPNHPTFSAESMYSTPADQGGAWLPQDGGRWAFSASPDNFRHQTPDMLSAYMTQVEPDSALILPVGGARAPVNRFGRRPSPR